MQITNRVIDNLSLTKLQETYLYVFLGILCAGLCNFVGLQFFSVVTAMFWPLVIAEFVMLFAFFFFRNIFTYLGFTSLTGLTLVPVIGGLVSAGMAHVVFQALLGTGAITGGLTAYAMTTKRNFLRLAPLMFWVVVGLLVVSLANLFFQSSALALGISLLSTLVFSIWIIIDTQQVLQGNVEPLDAAMNLYIDILNLFVNLLHLLAAFSGADD